MTLVDYVIVHTEKTKADLIRVNEFLRNKLEVIRHGMLDLDDQIFVEEEKAVLEIFKDLGNKKMVFGVLGAIDYYKGTDIALNAWVNSPKLSSIENIELVIAGRNNGLPLQNGEIKNVMLIEHELTNVQFSWLLKRCNVIIMPYRKISQSGLLLSALKRRKLLIVSNAGELSVPFRFGNIGWIIGDLDPDHLGKVLEQAVSEFENGSLKEIPEGSWEKIDLYYSWEQSGKKTSSLYKKGFSEKKICGRKDGICI